MDLAFYATAGPLTHLTEMQTLAVRGLGLDAVGLCRAVQGLLVLPDDAFGASLSAHQMAERNLRPATDILERAIALDPAPFDHPRDVEQRVVGTCRHFALLATALLRAVDIPARSRCGFASYFVPSRYVDHWIVEYWREAERRWVRIDPEVIDGDLVGDPGDLGPGAFASGGEAWQAIRRGHADPSHFGVAGTQHWGPGEVRGNAIRDLAALNKIEMLPWDEWGPMADSYQGITGDDFDDQIDELASICANADAHPGDDLDDLAALRRCYQRFAVPADLIA